MTARGARSSLWLCALLFSITIAAQDEGPPQREQRMAKDSAEWNRNPAPKDPRDFSGVWWIRGYDRTFRPVSDPPLSPREAARLLPLTPAEAASWQHHIDMEKMGTPIADAPTQCFPHGVPRLVASPYPVQFVYSPGLITLLHEVGHNVRYFHVDGKPPPSDTPRTFLGYSVGHWEGNTLVVVTDHFNDRTQIDEEALSHGLKLKVTERFTRRTNRYSGAEIQDLITLEDPDHFTRPWTAERVFYWRGDVRINEYSCEENNRNAPVNGVTVAK